MFLRSCWYATAKPRGRFAADRIERQALGEGRDPLLEFRRIEVNTAAHLGDDADALEAGTPAPGGMKPSVPSMP